MMGVRLALGLSFLSDRLTTTTRRNSLPVNHRCRKTYRHVSKRRVNGDVGILYETAPRIRPPRGFDLGRCFWGLPSCVHLVQGVAPLTSHSERYTFCIAIRFEWDSEKNWIKQQKHGGIAFESAALVFDDPHVIFRKDR